MSPGKATKWVGILALLVIAVLSQFTSTQPAEAQGAGPRQGFAGTVSSFDGTLLVIDVSGGAETGSVEITVGEDATIITAAHAAVPEIQSNLQAGASVAVLAEEVDGDWQAVHVVLKPVTPAINAVTGAVVSVEDGVLTIARPNGEIKTIQIPDGAVGPPAGQMVTVMSRTQQASEDAPGVMLGLRTAEQVQTRLQTFLDDLTSGSGDLPMVALEQRDRLLLQIADRLEEHSRLRVQALEQVCDRVCDNDELPLQARDKIQTALENAQQLQAQAMEKAEAARAKVQPTPKPTNVPGGPSDGSPGQGNNSQGTSGGK